MTDFLPTYTLNGTLTEDLKTSVFAALTGSKDEDRLDLFYYSASVAGWRLVAPTVTAWAKGKNGRQARAFVGTDHGFTDPLALAEMLAAGIDVRVVTMHAGIYHPKVVILRGAAGGSAWVGSNNLSESALIKNVEFALKTDFKNGPPGPLVKWIAAIEAASEPLTQVLLKSYENERNAFEKKTASFTAPKFVWSKRRAPKAAAAGAPAAPPPVAALPGALIMEITPRETGGDGKQVQPPLKTVGSFFGLPGGPGASRVIQARMKGIATSHPLTLTRQMNLTARLVIAELDYSHRPGFLVFEKVGPVFEYEIVTQADEPARYGQLAALATNQTRPGSRHWKVLP